MKEAFDDFEPGTRRKSTREIPLERRCGNYAKSHGAWHRKFKSPGKRSAPDRIFARNGKVWFVEFKALGKKPTELQLKEHATMRSAGLDVSVLDNDADFVREFNRRYP